MSWILGTLAMAVMAGTLTACASESTVPLRIELRDFDTDRPGEGFAGEVEPGDEIVLEVYGPDLTLRIETVSQTRVEFSTSYEMMLTDADGGLKQTEDGTRFTVTADEPVLLLTPTLDAATELTITLG